MKEEDPMALRIGMLLYPRLNQLDLTGPHEVLSNLPDTEIFLAWKTREPVVAESGLLLQPTTTLDAAPRADVLFVPGGSGGVPLMEDAEVLAFLRRQAAEARFVTAVCTGSLLLGAAGLLHGYQATTHWAYHDLLPACGAHPVRRRVVTDRDRVTGGGVTAGIDFSLELAALLVGRRVAEAVQLGLEYDPAPPFDAGSPERAAPELVEFLRRRFQPLHDERARILARRQLAAPGRSGDSQG
jgi:cyclohexyl-isocyanide hydratase